MDEKIKKLCEELADITQMLKDEGYLTAKEGKYLINRLAEVQVGLLEADRKYDAENKKEVKV